MAKIIKLEEERKKLQDEETVKNIRKMLAGHGEQIVDHGIAYDSAVTKLYSTEGRKRTVQDVLPDINEALQGVLKKYLKAVGIEGDQASTYLHDLTLNLRELRQIYNIRPDTVFDSTTAQEIKSALQDRIRSKLRDIIGSELGKIEDDDTLSDIISSFVEESGDKRFDAKEAKKTVKDYQSALNVFNQVYSPLLTQYESTARAHQKKEYKKTG
jgi:hypothetical protein